jgi:hypothetical protein
MICLFFRILRTAYPVLSVLRPNPLQNGNATTDGYSIKVTQLGDCSEATTVKKTFPIITLVTAQIVKISLCV